MGVISNSDLIADVEDTPVNDDNGVPTDEPTAEPTEAVNAEPNGEVPGDEPIGDGEQVPETDDVATDSGGEDGDDPVVPDADDQSTSNFTLKINGEEVEVSLDDLKRGYATNSAANQKFQAAAEQRKQAEAFINLLKTDPMAVLQDPSIGLDARSVAEQYLAEQLQIENMSPEQRELYDAKRALANFEQDKKQQEQVQQQEQMAALTQQYEAEYDARIKTALGDANLPVTQQTTERMATYMYQVLNAEDAATQNLSDKDLVELVRQDYIQDFQHLFGSTDADTLVNILGADVTKKLRAADIARVNGGKKAPVQSAPKAVKKEPETRMSQADFNAYLDSLE